MEEVFCDSHWNIAVRRCSVRAVKTERSGNPWFEVLQFWFGDSYFTNKQALNERSYLRERAKVWYRGGRDFDDRCKVFIPLMRKDTSSAP
eukprot:6464118-Amphidinium_carterae.1